MGARRYGIYLRVFSSVCHEDLQSGKFLPGFALSKIFVLFVENKRPANKLKSTNRPRDTNYRNIGSDWSNKMSCAVFHWNVEPIFLHVKISCLLRVIKYDFPQWPKTLYHTEVYEINIFPDHWESRIALLIGWRISEQRFHAIDVISKFQYIWNRSSILKRRVELISCLYVNLNTRYSTIYMGPTNVLKLLHITPKQTLLQFLCWLWEGKENERSVINIQF